MKKLVSTLSLALSLGLLAAVHLHAAAIETAALSNSLAAGDDQTSGNVNLGFSINFGGTSYSALAVNTNGNLSLGDGGFGQGTPTALADSGRTLIAPFWADVDTRGNGVIQYGAATIAGRQTFVATYSNVGSYLANTTRTNSFQVIIFNRADTGAGNFDVEFNYDRIQWDSGDDSAGVSAVAGLIAAAPALQLQGSLLPGSFLDGAATSLVSNSLNARNGVAGRYDFSVRSGSVLSPIPEPAALWMTAVGFMLVGIGALKNWRRSRNPSEPRA